MVCKHWQRVFEPLSRFASEPKRRKCVWLVHSMCSYSRAPRYSQFVPVSEANPRFLSIRECCRLQGFPESFVLPEGFGPRNEFYGMIGNAVPVPMVCAVGLAVEKALGIGGGEGVLLRVLKEAARDPEAVERAWVKGWPKIVSDASCVLKARGEAEADVNT